jgi:hypothetical protein
MQNKRDELANGKLPYHAKGAGTLLATMVACCPWGSEDKRQPWKTSYSEKMYYLRIEKAGIPPTFPEYQAKGEKTHDKKTPNS